MNAADLDAIVDTARRAACETRTRFASIAAIDSWEAMVRDAADAVGATLTDRDQAALIATGVLVAGQVNAHLLRDPAVTWGVGAYNVARFPLQLTAGLLLPYLEERA